MAWHGVRPASSPALHRIDPLAGLARILSARTLAAAVGNAVALVAVVAVAAWVLGPLVAGGQRALEGVDLAADPVPMITRGQAAILPLAAAAAVIAAVQWGLSRWRFEKRIRMTPQEYQDEARSLQADPKVKLMREQARRPRSAPSPAPDSRSDR